MNSVPEEPKRRGFTGKRGDPSKAPRCGAKTKSSGRPCQAPAMRNPATGKVLRCHKHGGCSPGPTAEGRARLSVMRTKHGLYTKAAIEARKQLRERLAALKAKSEAPK